MVVIYRKKFLKLEEGENDVALSDQEPDKDDADIVVENAKDSCRDVLLDSDRQNTFGDTLSVHFNHLGDQ
jgi:hypothetical protein